MVAIDVVLPWLNISDIFDIILNSNEMHSYLYNYFE